MTTTTTTTTTTTLKKFFAFNSKPNSQTFPELTDAIIWCRFVLAVFYGIYLGLSQVLGGVNVLFALNTITFLPVLYCQFILAADTESYKNLTFAGVGNSIALFLLIWIYFFTVSFADDEAKLAAAVNTAMSMATPPDTRTDETPLQQESISTPNEPVIIEEDTEF